MTRIFEKNYINKSKIKSIFTLFARNNITCSMVPGDGIGPELMDAVLKVFKAGSIPVQFKIYDLRNKDERELTEQIESIRKSGICLKSAFVNDESTLSGDYQNMNVRIRNVLDVYANVAHFRTLAGVKTRHENVDFYIVREQTEAAYTNLEHESVKGVVESLKVVTSIKSRRIAKFAFDYATKFDRKSVTCIHKANIMKLSDGLFLRSCKKISELYPKIKFKSMIVDNCMMQLVSNPQQFDVMVTPNLYGNIADNLSAGLVGGAGVVPGASFSSECVVFEPAAHHAFLTGAGKNIANPTAMLLCAVKMLNHCSLFEHYIRLRNAIIKVLSDGKVRTFDIGGKASLNDFTSAVINNMK